MVDRFVAPSILDFLNQDITCRETFKLLAGLCNFIFDTKKIRVNRARRQCRELG